MLQRSELSRDGEQYLTVVETHASEVNRIFGMTRANTSNIVQYYVNGTMITGYGMDPNGHIESYLMNADIWWRCVGWLGRINAHAYEEPALVFPCPNLMTKRQLTAVPPHRSGIFVAGEIEVDPDTLKLLGPNAVRKWERDSPMPLTIPDDHKQFMTTLSPPAYNAFARPQVSSRPTDCSRGVSPSPRGPPHAVQVLKMQCIWKALIVKLAPNRVVIVDPKSMKDGRCTLWHLPKDLTRIESIASEQQQPRERRAYGWLRHEVIEESRGHTIKIPDMSKAEEVIVCVPPMRKFVQHEGLPIFLVQRTLGRDGLEVRQRATEYDCCVSLRRDYFSRKTLNEGVFQRRMNESLGAQLKEAKGGKVRIIHKAFVPINQFMAFCALLECETGDGANELELNYSDRDLKEQAKLLVRMYGTRIFKLTGIGSNRIDKYHVIMPSTCKLVYNVETQMVSQRLGIYTTSSTFTPMGGQIMDPCPEPEKIMQYHFSLESVKWKRGPNRDRPSVVDKNVRVLTYESTEEHFGMNGTEL
jgi:hypothetical protein